MPASAPSAGAASAGASAGASVVSSAGASSAFSGEQAARARTLAAAKTGLSLIMDFMVLFPFVAETRARVLSTPKGLWQDIILQSRQKDTTRRPDPFIPPLRPPAYSPVPKAGKEDKIGVISIHAGSAETAPSRITPRPETLNMRGFRLLAHLPCAAWGNIVTHSTKDIEKTGPAA